LVFCDCDFGVCYSKNGVIIVSFGEIGQGLVVDSKTIARIIQDLPIQLIVGVVYK
jgi:hypothetical protein